MAETVSDIDSILNTVKSGVEIDTSDLSFDVELIMHINTILSHLAQIGIGPDTGYSIKDANDKWSDFITDQTKLMLLNNVKTYVTLKVRLIFDSPTSSVIKEAYEKQIKEIENRMYVTMGGY